jgi:hypothetical protein
LGLGFRKNIFFRENPQKEGHLDGLINTIVPSSQNLFCFALKTGVFNKIVISM